MDFTQAIKTCLVEKYACFTGRARRSEFWYFSLFSFVASLIVTGLAFIPIIGSIINIVFCFGIIIPSLSVTTRRLHDTGRSGWHIVISYVIAVIAIILMFSGVGLENIINPERVDYATMNMPLLIVGFILYLIATIYSIVIFVFELMDSNPGENKYGPNPKGDSLDSSDY